ncbi:MAG: hypothetical protein ACHQQ3_00765 [Gemmatimonadales bacterium]
MLPIARLLCVTSLVALPCAMAGCLTSPKTEALRQAQMQEAADAINDLRVTTSTLEGTLDSLRYVVAKQDTTIARLANVTGVVVVK